MWGLRLKHLHHLQRCQQHVSCQQPVRSLFSVTGTWASDFTPEMRDQLESYWKNHLPDHPAVSNDMQDAKKFYVLSMFPYPSGRLHMGHVRVYTISDAMARYHRLSGKQVIHPMGWDAFGLPAENAAIERNERPDTWTYSNIDYMKKQLKDLCFSFDWDREFATCDPSFYKWTQYLFLKMFDAGLVYQKEAPVNWDPVDQTVLADEQVDENGCSWRSGAPVEKKFLRQWYIKTTAYSKSLYDGLAEVDPQFWRDIIALQKNWIGECDGVRVSFKTRKNGVQLDTDLSSFTRHPEALTSVSHIFISPDHMLNQESHYKSSSDGDLILLDLEIINPITQRAIPVYVSKTHAFGEFLDTHLGMPNISEEDHKFAARHNLNYCDEMPSEDKANFPETEGLSKEESLQNISQYLKKLGCGGEVTSERSRDWLISRQRYWGTPIPIVHCDKYGAVPVAYDDLPVQLPKVTSFTGKGGSPLAQDKEWVKVKCAKCDCDGYGHRETDTMDTFVDSSWYFLRYIDPHNTSLPFSADIAHKYMPVDLYIGGKEHAIMHMYYARFFNHFLHDAGLVPTREPFINLLTQGMVMGRSYRLKNGRYIAPDKVKFVDKVAVEAETNEPVIEEWEKMSKSKYNGVDPEDVLKQHGCDATRLCILSNVAPQSHRNWSDDAFLGVYRWQQRLWSLVHDMIEQQHLLEDEQTEPSLTENQMQEAKSHIFDSRNYFLKEVNFHMETTFQLSVAISRLQGLTNDLKRVSRDVMASCIEYEEALIDLVIMISPFAPMFASELWTGLQSCAHKSEKYHWDKSVFEQDWPKVDSHYHLPLKVKVKKKDIFEVQSPVCIGEEASLTKEQVLALVQDHPLFPDVPAQQINTKLSVQPGYKVELVLNISKKKKQKVKQTVS